MPEQNLPAFQKSIGNELLTIRNRVRNLIGSAHRGEEGRYKESVLKKMIREYLPHNLSIGSWFIVSKNGGQSHISKQIDILIYDNSYPVVFRDEDFVIITQDMVKAIIEVKSNVAKSWKNSLRNLVNNFNRLENFEILQDGIRENSVFSWIFAYENEKEIKKTTNLDIENTIKKFLKEYTNYTKVKLKYVNHICLSNNIFFKSWRNNEQVNPHIESKANGDSPFFNIYRIKKYSFWYFLSNLLHTVSTPSLQERSAFSFTIPDPYGKEWFLKRSVQIATHNNHQN